jgi:hypothetical protein
MKKLNYLIVATLAVFTMFSMNTFGQAGKDSTKNNRIVINAKGGIYDHGGTKLGYVTKDNIVKNNKGQTLYFIDKSGNVIDARGNKLGMAKKNGDYFNNDGQTVLQLKNVDAEKCEILDPVGHNWGYVHRNYKLHACAAHCFFLQKEKDKEKITKM